MSVPTLTFTGQRLYDQLAPLATEDATYGWALAHFCAAFAAQLDEVADLSRDQDDGTIGWASLFDLDNVPAKFLPWLGLFVGVTMPGSLTAAAQRLRIRQTDGFRRGTPDAIQGAARQTLIGPDGTPDTATVFLEERIGGDAYHLTVATLTSETPDSAATQAAILAQKPAGLVLTYSTVTGGDFLTLRDTHTDFADVKATFATFADVRSNPSA